MIFLAWCTLGVSVLMSIPSVTGVAQAGARFLLPATSTQQIRQEAFPPDISLCSSR